MCQDHDDTKSDAPVPVKGRRGAWRRIIRSKDGAAAIEFALLAIPYFLIVFAIVETFIAYTGEQLVANAVDTMARKLRTGNITYQLGRTTYKNETDFRRAFCAEISIMITCSDAEITTPDKLLLDVRSFASFALIPTTIPRTGGAFGDLDTSSFAYAPGPAKSINMLRAYYRWDVITDLIRPYITNVRPADGGRPNYFLIVETSAFRAEDYP
ncbi:MULTISPECIES: TadE/TadG family type IV pilus assembly protein [unclassified Neorhizobium]|uniref:TadE/TadG family type IV pilus assembly protein n=1 Tax=unclassified Neorhizobium TaxID=2629175 RepID=UPI001FF6122C|nr:MULTISPECIES: TadE/TadG family type IV pilus assembly protein [unclassified Neorhizobium]MCJ9673417.1 pilus assembly protein [Neorhizobium sp. SHOUNA12B]MCJ9746870.1 pilus assembly protein [Neorhizobium sp. SHOUNA12A]